MRLTLAILVASALPAWAAAADLSAGDPSSCCGESCPAGGEGAEVGCASCCGHALWVNPGAALQAPGEGQAPDFPQIALTPQAFSSPPERPPDLRNFSCHSPSRAASPRLLALAGAALAAAAVAAIAAVNLEGGPLELAQELFGVGNRVSFVVVQVDDVSRTAEHVPANREATALGVISDEQML